MKKKVVSILLCTAMIATMAAGCGKKNSSDDSAKSNETVKLTVWAGEEDQDLTNELVSKFEDENKDQKFDITVGVESESTAKDTILVDPEAAADVFAFASDQITDLVNANVLQEVQDTDTITKENVDSSIEASTVDGKLYAYPFAADNGYFLFYDKNVVSEEDAKSWDKILEDCQAAGKKAGMVYASGWYTAGFFYGAGFTTELEDDGSTKMDWNETSSTGVKGTDVAQGMIDIAKNPAFLPITDGDTTNQIATGSLGAIVSGTWDATAVKEAFGDGYAATILPSFTCGGKEVQMGSAAGYKMMGVNANSKQVGWAMELAKYLTNEDSQKARFEEREIGPSNKKISESDEVKANVALAAVTEQNKVAGVVQSVGTNYWDPAKSFGEIMAQGNPDGTDLQSLLDNLVDAASQPAK
nr:extracellular solute-binding protein [uncultured Dorea sp.]